MLFKTIENLIFDIGMNETLSRIIVTLINITIIVALSFGVYFLLKLAAKIATKLFKSESAKYAIKCAYTRNLPKKISWLFVVILINSLAYIFPEGQALITKIATFVSIIILMIIIDCIMKIICDIYATKEISKKRPIKGVCQIVEILIFLVFGIIMLSMLINQSPLVLIGGIGTFTAILSIVFKDALLGLVAGVQITADDLLRIGDWVEIPSQGVEGTVKDISLISVKILAFDNTLFTIPAYTFLSVPFKNWHTAISTKARRVDRFFNVDVRTIKALNNKELEDIANKYEYEDLKDVFDQAKKASGEVTNLVVFRELLVRKIKEDSRVCKDRLIVCQVSGESSSKGVPVEFIFFTKDTDWVDYSKVSASKLDLAICLASELGLKAFQDKSDTL